MPNQASELANEGMLRSPPVSAAIGLSAIQPKVVTQSKDNQTSRGPAAVTAARLDTDEGTARRLFEALAESCDGESVAVSIARAQEPAAGAPEGEKAQRWSLALHFREPPDETAVRSLIAGAAAPDAIDPSRDAFAQALGRDLRFETLAPVDWVTRSLEGLAPVRAGRFLVHTAHHRDRPGANGMRIEIEATVAFGTGHHGSTRGCLLALDRIAKRAHRRRRRKLAGTRARTGRCAGVLDLGTGTGVLAIAAAKALHRRVVATDIDGRAVAIARENARRNGVAPRLTFLHAAGLKGRRLVERKPFCLILANILLEPLRDLATPIARVVDADGRVVLSGLLSAQASAALAAYRARGLKLDQRIALGGWTTLVLRR
jgi:ribosomal protein L11 methyltransferase